MTSPTSPRRTIGHIEPLESRIAPATLLIGAQGTSDDTTTTPHNNVLDTDYVDPNPGERPGKNQPIPGDSTATIHPDFGALNFVDIFDGSINGGAANPFDQIALGLRGDVMHGTALDATPHKYFYVRLHAGDEVKTFVNFGYSASPLISVTAGDVIAVFTDFETTANSGASENNYDPGEFTGLILGPGAKVQINGGVNGDIVSALDTHKTANTADDTLDFVNLVSSKQNIGNLKVLGGSVKGGIYAGGSIDNLTVDAGSVQNVLVGTAANSHSFDFVQSDVLAPRFTSQVSFAKGTPGASISNTILQNVVERVEAGAGGLGAKGGALTNITINADTDGFALIAGRGGDVDALQHVTVGGAGGSLTKINVQGTSDTTPNSVGTLSITVQGVATTINGAMLVAGDGGGSVVGTTATRGGAGGSITGVTAGIVKNIVANDVSADSFHLFGGLGGNGKTGGAGGSITSASVVISTQDALGNEIEVIAGDGGTGGVAGLAGGVAGAGGNITTVSASNTYFTNDPTISLHASTLIQAGAGGLTLDPSATGAAGGSIKTVTLVGFDSDVEAGSGSDGNSGGKGGGITGLTYTASQTVITHNIVINAGHGGNAGKLAGGAGGAIVGVKAPLVDLETLYVNTAFDAAKGGDSLTGRGGAGGAITSLDVTDTDKAALNTNFLNGDVLINGGVGGTGGTGGGAGGALNTVHVEGDHFAFAIQSGQGGNATTKGIGGAGGLVAVAFFKSSGSLNDVDPQGNPILTHPGSSVIAGMGGDGAGAGGRGGVGGDLRGVSASNEGAGLLQAGTGGNGELTVGAVKGGAAGKGGSITASGLISEFDSGAMLAGNAGVNGAAAAAGGNIVGSATTAVNGVRAATDVTIQAGDGSHGGAGGDITTLGFAGATGNAPTGKVLVKAGDGTGEGAVAGRGGNITGLTGVASSLGDGTITTQITAGTGGGGALVKASGAGGSLSHSTIATGGGPGAIIVIEAGNAGNATAAKTGGKGGSVTDVGFAALAGGTLIRSVAAGEGGIGTAKGGAGGSITQIFAPDNDIGYRTGQNFGYATQGGLFAGAGGVGGTGNGTNGSVTAVTATAISSIVAGARNSPIPHLAEKVADISLNATTSQLLLGRNSIFVPDGDFTLVFKGQSTGLLTGHSTDTQVATALNALSTVIAAGGVDVQYTTAGGYKITFKAKGAQPNIDAVEVVTRDVVETIPNSGLALPFMTGVNGEIALPNVATQAGTTPIGATITLPGSNLFIAKEVISGNINSNTKEVERIDTSSTGTGSNAEFTLTFLGDTTNRIPAGASASFVESELNNLPAVRATGFPGGSVGTVTVTQAGSIYTITFDTPGRQPQIAGQAYLQEIERVDLTTIQSSPSSKFTLTFNGATTVPIPINASAAVIEAALDNLSTVQATNVNFTGDVTVVAAGPGKFDVIFTENGFQSQFTGAATVPELQTIHVTGAASDTFFIKSGDQKTPAFKMGATAEEVQVALNQLPNIIAISGVTVTKMGQDYTVKFNQVGTQTLLEANLLQKEKQSIDLSNSAGQTTDYTIHSEYPVYINEQTPGQTTIIPVLDGTPALVTIGLGNQPPAGLNPLTGRITQAVAGTATVQEEERINFGAVSDTGGSGVPLKDGDLFILKFTDTLSQGGSTQNTVVIPFQTDLVQLAKDVESALNALPLVAAKGGLKVVRDTGAGFGNSLHVTYNNKAAVLQLGFEGNTPAAHPGGYQLFDPVPSKSFISTTVDGLTGFPEVQLLNVDTIVARGGVFNLSFAGQTTAFIKTSNNTIATDVEAQLNALSAISDFGGVKVLETSPGSHSYTITFGSGGGRPQITGQAVVPETEALNVSSLFMDPTDEFTLSFRGDTTPVFPQNATAATIETELNKLNSVRALSTVGSPPPAAKVRVFATGPGQFRVDFPSYLTTLPAPDKNGVVPDLAQPDFPNIVIASGGDAFHEIQHLDLRSLTAYNDGLFTLNFNGDTTLPLPQNATALDVENALNSLNSVQQTRHDVGSFFGTGQVAVTQTAHGEFDVKFNVFGQQNAFGGNGTVFTDRYPIQVTQTTEGTPAIIDVTEKVSGAYAGQPVIELVKGSPGSKETQRIDLSTFNGAGLGDFTISFGANTTAPLTFTGAGTPPTAAAVEAALNALPSVGAGGVTVVTVNGTNGVYDIAFTTNGDKPALGVQARHAEVQEIDLGALYTSTNGEYVLSFGGQKTANLPHNATAADITAALNGLSNIVAAGGVTAQQVGNSSKFDLTYGGLGNPANIVATGGLTQEIQRIDLGELVGSGAQFKLTFNGQTTGLLDANLSPSALAAEIQTALNALETVNDTRTDAANPQHTVSAIGQVTVTAGAEGNFFVTFDARGDVPAITGYSVTTQDRVIPVVTTVNGASTPVQVQSADGSPGSAEVQTIDLSALSGANTEFQLAFDNNTSPTDNVSAYTTGLLKAGATPVDTATTIQTALNALPSISAAGGVTVAVNANQTSFDVHFNSNGDQPSLSAAVGQHETQTVDVRALEKFHLANSTTVEGDAGNFVNEVQLIDLTGVQTDFTLQFGNDRTIALPANATLMDIENALNNLPSIMAAGNVTVSAAASTPTANHQVTVTFNTSGDVNQITGTADSANGVFRLGINGHLTQALQVGLIDPNGPTTAQSLIDLADALNAMPEVQALAGHNQGTVTVTLDAHGNYQIDYNGLGDQSLTAGGTFSVEPTVDLHRVTDGAANGAIPLPIFESTAGRAIGPVTSTITQGATATQEVQTVDLTGEFASGSGNITFTFNGDSTSVNAGSPTLDTAIQNQLNQLVSVQNTAPGGTGSVTVSETAPGSHIFTVHFNANGDQPLLGVIDTNQGTVFQVSETTPGGSSLLEVQKLDLNGLPNSSFQVQFGGANGNVTLNGASQMDNAALLESALDNLGTIPGGVSVTSNGDANGSFGTFTVTFNQDGNVAQIGATSFVTTETTMGGLTNEVQHIDLSQLQAPSAAGSTFALSYNGEVTAPLSRFATANDVQTALNSLPQFAGPNNVTVQGGSGLFDVTFGDTVDHAGLILAQAGNEEVQHIDTTSLQGQGAPNFTLTFMGQQTSSIPAGASGSQVEFLLNQLAAVQQAGGVTVTESLDAQNNLSGYDVHFNTFADQPSILGSVAVHEQLILDLHNLQNESGFLTFKSGGVTSQPAQVRTDASAFVIQQAINSVSGANPVLVTQLHPGVFQISYQNSGAPAPLEAFVNKEGNSVRVPAGASTAELESAADNVSLSDVALTGANGLYNITFADNGDQVTLGGLINVHEQLRPDLFAGQGGFHIVIGAEQTVDLPANATADQIRLALDDLSAVQDLGGVRSVKINPDSSFLVTFAGDYELPAIQFVARQNLLANNIQEVVPGDVNNREIQIFSYTIQGAFDAAKFANARLVGAIADFNEFDSNRFHFYDLVNNPGSHVDSMGVARDINNVPLPPVVATANNPFKEGDLPIDGIVMAKTIDPKTTNFIPEAALIANPDKTVGGNLFFDYLNNR